MQVSSEVHMVSSFTHINIRHSLTSKNKSKKFVSFIIELAAMNHSNTQV